MFLLLPPRNRLLCALKSNKTDFVFRCSSLLLSIKPDYHILFRNISESKTLKPFTGRGTKSQKAAKSGDGSSKERSARSEGHGHGFRTGGLPEGT